MNDTTKKIKTPEAGIMLIIKDGRILCVSRKDDHACFGLPGGKKELSDLSIKDTAIRETFEETGITIKDCVFIRDRIEPGAGVNPVDYHSYCFYALDWEGEAKDHEGAKVKWLTLDQLLSGNSPFLLYIKETIKAFQQLYPNVKLIKLPFVTTENQNSELPSYLNLMNSSGISKRFTEDLNNIAKFDQGVFDLIKMWAKESDVKERTNIINDLEISIKDYDF